MSKHVYVIEVADVSDGNGYANRLGVPGTWLAVAPSEAAANDWRVTTNVEQYTRVVGVELLDDVIVRRRRVTGARPAHCPDCGARGEIAGHQDCAFPATHA